MSIRTSITPRLCNQTNCIGGIYHFLGERVILYRAISVKEIKSSLFTDITVTPVSCTVIFVIFCQYLVCACKINKKTQTYNTFATILQQKPAK